MADAKTLSLSLSLSLSRDRGEQRVNSRKEEDVLKPNVN